MYCVLCHYPKWKVVFMPLMGFMSAVDDPFISCVATGDLPIEPSVLGSVHP